MELKLDLLQFHGDETPQYCKNLRDSLQHQRPGLQTIKVFSLKKSEDVAQTAEYEGMVDYFLFDTPCEGGGGSGEQFDWSLLASYQGNTPFLLSGGINNSSIEAIKEFAHPMCIGIDVNSCFELAPGVKNVEMLETFLSNLNE